MIGHSAVNDMKTIESEDANDLRGPGGRKGNQGGFGSFEDTIDTFCECSCFVHFILPFYLLIPYC